MVSQMANSSGWTRKCLLLLLVCGTVLCGGNHPPRFVLDTLQSEIVLNLKEGAENPAGSAIYRLKAIDPDGDPLQFALKGKFANEILRIQPVSHNEADLILQKELDREVQDEYSFVITVTDGHLGEGNFITQSLLILVEDVNDNVPVFKPFPASVTVRENSFPGVILKVEATDRDEGAYGQVVYNIENDDGETGIFSISTVSGAGIIRCLSVLDYETKSLYQLKILASDRANSGPVNTATALLLVRVEDEEDQPPEFVSLPSLTRVPEDVKPGSPILQVKAVDGDRGINNRISYLISGGNTNLFQINPIDGGVVARKNLNREDPASSNGAYVLQITATEEGSGIVPKPTVTSEITILLLDINDETPTFKSSQYIAEIDENSPLNMPVSFVGDSVNEVFDFDQGVNGTFTLSLEGDGGIFEVIPAEALNEASFMIRVRNPALLDYETIKSINCTITAREKVSVNPKSSSASIVILIRDVNDNIPAFVVDSYQVSVQENSPSGTTVAWIQAVDEDSGDFGTSGIRYTSIKGSIAEKLQIDPESGIITIRSADSAIFDREKFSEFTITVEARDFLGLGNRNAVQVTIALEDVNDNAPLFTQPQYETYIEENSAQFPVDFAVHAFDKDLNGTRNSDVRYSILDGNPLNNFTIDPFTGQIRVTRPLDFEMIPASRFARSSGSIYTALGNVRPINLTIQATDLGTPAMFSTVPVVVYVHDVNDFAPVFSKSAYSKTVPEDTPGGTPILQLTAFDMDGSSPNNLVAYRIQNGATDKFVIDASTGIVSVASGANLDPDRSEPRITSYSLEILALDGGLGSEQKHSNASVLITISDVNNKAPVLRDPGIIRVPENVPVGYILTQFAATDLDERPVLQYWLDSEESEGRNENSVLVRDSESNVTSWFEVTPLDGVLRVVRELDREKIETLRLVVHVEDLAARTPGQTSTGTLTIVVEDVNDNDPQFLRSFYRRSIPENSKRGTPILTLTAEDPDRNRTIRYSLDGPREILELVHLDSDTGEIVVAGKIDREKYSWLNFTARATDSGYPPRSTVVPVYIQVLDENDNNPQFVNVPVNISVREDSPVGTTIANIEAFDPDIGDFGQITYLMDRRSSQGKFALHPETGALTIADKLDREEKNSYTLVIQAWDNYKYGYTAGESRNAFQQITVTILDVNDEPPVFEAFAGCATVTEFHDPRVPITVVRAMDRDDPSTPNGKVAFSIEAGNDGGLFGIVNMDYTSARIFAMKPLVGCHGNYSLRIKAQDRGFPANTAFQNVAVCVTDFNDHSPRFVYPQQNTTIKIPENATVGSLVTAVSAVDEDYGANGEVRYRLRKDPLGHWKSFHIDERTGLITLTETLDREKQKLYEIRVEATDQGSPTPLSSDLDLFIYVRNINDYEPEFLVRIFEVNITENVEPGLVRILLPETIDRDDPEDPNAPADPVCVYIIDGNEDGYFDINPKTRTLTTTKLLDRESQSSHVLLVRATENCGNNSSLETSYDPDSNSTLRIVINVIDINDNAPRFTKEIFTAGFTTEADFGTEILRVQAEDQDWGNNSVLSYFINPPIQATLAEGLDNLGPNPFLIVPETGAILLNFDPQREMKGYFDMEVYVNDTGGLSHKSRVFLYLLREDQRLRFVLRQHPQQFRSRIDLFRDVLGNITKCIVNVDDYKTHSNEDGTVDKTRTDVFMHFVNPEDNSILEVDAALRLIDSNIEALNDLFKDFNVLDTSPAELVRLERKPRNYSLFWASGTAVFLAIILFLVLGLCISQRLRLLRKLRAASATAFGSPASSCLHPSTVPNTNQHTVEGSNPIWRHDVESEWFKPEELYSNGSVEQDGLDSLDVNAILGNETLTPRRSSSTNTASLRSNTETFNRGIVHPNVISARQLLVEAKSSSTDSSAHDTTTSEKERDLGELKEEQTAAGIAYQRNIYHFGYPVFEDKLGNPLIPRKLETTEL